MSPVSFARAVEESARTMLLVCGTMTMLRVFATLTDFLPDAMRLPLTTLLEVTTGAVTIANLPAPLPLRIALLSAATGFGHHAEPRAVPARIDAAGRTAGVAGAARRDFGDIGAGNRAAGAERGRKFVTENL